MRTIRTLLFATLAIALTSTAINLTTNNQAVYAATPPDACFTTIPNYISNEGICMVGYTILAALITDPTASGTLASTGLNYALVLVATLALVVTGLIILVKTKFSKERV